jgi:hypothetical protein
MSGMIIDQRGFLSGIIAGGSVYGISQRPKIFVRTNDPVAAEVASHASLAANSVELGDLFSTEADAIVSAGNGVGHMNGGVDLRIRADSRRVGLRKGFDRRLSIITKASFKLAKRSRSEQGRPTFQYKPAIPNGLSLPRR